MVRQAWASFGLWRWETSGWPTHPRQHTPSLSAGQAHGRERKTDKLREYCGIQKNGREWTSWAQIQHTLSNGNSVTPICVMHRESSLCPGKACMYIYTEPSIRPENVSDPKLPESLRDRVKQRPALVSKTWGTPRSVIACWPCMVSVVYPPSHTDDPI